MSSAYLPLSPAAPDLDERGAPYSPLYGDVYHNVTDALGQAHHVFLRGNGLPQRWRARDSFTVCETGFGLGLNFLTLWQAWREDPARCARLHYVSLEAHPCERQVLANLLRRVMPDAMQVQVDQLIEQWPPLLPGLHRLEFEGGALTLTLGFGLADTLAAQLSARVDAFFLDGFAPDRNPDMWSSSVFRSLAKLAMPGATLATWACAGFVRRALHEAGFDVRKQAGFGGKWQMTIGVWARPWSTRCPAALTQTHAVVIGAGLAGAGIAQALSLRGWTVTVLDAADTEATHAGHLAAALSPIIARDDNPRARLARAGSQRAWRRWSGLAGDAAPQRCGTLQLERDVGRAVAMSDALATLCFPETWVRGVDQNEASALAGMPVSRGGLFFSDGMSIRPGMLIEALLALPGIERRCATAARLRRQGSDWQVLDAQDRELVRAQTVIVANAGGALDILSRSHVLETLPRLAQMQVMAGEITLLPSTSLNGGPRCIVGGEGYLLPAHGPWCVAGSTYVNDAPNARVGLPGQQMNLQKVAGLLGYMPPGVASLPAGQLPGWAGWRAVLPGSLPMVGEVPHEPGLWLAVGYASRGLSWSALMGDVIAARLCGEPLPLEAKLAGMIAPR